MSKPMVDTVWYSNASMSGGGPSPEERALACWLLLLAMKADAGTPAFSRAKWRHLLNPLPIHLVL